MSIMSVQKVGWSVKQVDRRATMDGKQSVIPTGYKNLYKYFAWFVAEDEITDVLRDALPPDYVREGEPTVVEIERIKHYNVEVTGVSYTDQALSPVHEAAHSGNFS